MNHHILIVATALALVGSRSAQAEVKITIGHNDSGTATSGFKFKNIPAPSGKAAPAIKFTIVDAEVDPVSGGLAKLNDGKLPVEEDSPDDNFFFNAGTAGGRLKADLGSVISIKQINTYSWHPATRGPQVYKLYASDGTANDFNSAPTNGLSPESCGWTQIATVNSKAKGGDADGGQYGVSISDTDGILGKYRYLLFDIATTENDDDFGNTFFSEINVVDANDTNVTVATEIAEPAPFSIKTADGEYEIIINTVAAPALKDWAETRLAPALIEWYPKIVALLPSKDYSAPARFTLTLKPMDGVAYTAGTQVVANSTWLGKELRGEAIGSIVHEMVHVVQQYHGNNPGWLVEGTADYVRWFKYEPQSHGADMVWFRKHGKSFSPHYNDSYRITANFLNCVAEKHDPNIVGELNAAMREGTYDAGLWEKYTGKTLPELGKEWDAQRALPN